jgi:hypothetical protein
MAPDDNTHHALDIEAEEAFVFAEPGPSPVTNGVPAIDQQLKPLPKRVQVVNKNARPGQNLLKSPPPRAQAGAPDITRMVKLVVRAPQAPAQVKVTREKISKSSEQTSAATAEPMQVAIPLEIDQPTLLDVTTQVLSESPQPPRLSKPSPQPREFRTAAELAAMIEMELAQHPQSPTNGLRITVYGGANNWRAMLSIMPAAGPVRDPQALRDLTDQLAERLLRRYDLAWE